MTHEYLHEYLHEDYDYLDDERGIYGRVIDGTVHYKLEDAGFSHEFGYHHVDELVITGTELQVTYYDRDGGELFTEIFEPDLKYYETIYETVEKNL